MSLSAFIETSPGVFETNQDPVIVSNEQVRRLAQAAKTAPRGRARLLLHQQRSDNLHEMVIALPPDSCDHPHINFRSGKSFLALSGQFAVMRFSDDGSTIEPFVLSAGRQWAGCRMIRLRQPAWHTIIPLGGDTVFLETIIGPFEGNRFADWFPDAVQEAAREAWSENLREIARAAAV